MKWMAPMHVTAAVVRSWPDSQLILQLAHLKLDFSNNNVFPIFEQTQVVVPSVLDKTLFGNIDFSGKQQLTYKGWPLHFFGQDSVRGLTLAVSVPVAGKWPVAVKNIGDPKR